MINRSNMFTQSCLIRKNTEEIRDKIRKLGYKIASKTHFEERRRGILCRSKLAIGIPDDCYEFSLDKYLKDNPNIIDCGTNELLFIALAALSDDSDINQWFVHNTLGFFIECTHEEFHLFAFNPFDALDYKDTKDEFHKATPQELIEHFSK